MRSRTLTGMTLAGGILAAATAAPAGAATLSTPALPVAGDGLAPIVKVAKTPLIRRDLRLARTVARVKGTKLKQSYAKTIRAWSITKLTRHHTHLKRELRAARRAAEQRSTASPALEAIAACESGGNPRTDTGNGFYGKYQFTLDTWQAVGGSGNPARASEAEQDRRAAQLMARAGAGQWPVCGA
ncbi:transglycosylase [Baekduia alba]|uniref:transglycosylase family protein n=1 Tax=Baekduia alba TaxID=2997333 RepID=UPI002342687B|nr:transglycosylase family protein [Baekduia alba]WCB93815.1 transglycosylase [Baekduia alba]